VDGVVLINQSTVMAAGGFPYTISSPGSYKLSGNLIAPANVNGIQIAASNVTLDLAGFSIGGPDQTCTTVCLPVYGITAVSPVIGVTVRNGAISGFGGQINLATNGSFSLVEDLILFQFGSFQAQSGFGVSSVVRHVIANSIIALQCPSVIVESVTQGYGTGHASGCVFGNSSGPVF
jgi:hypothetical protein